MSRRLWLPLSVVLLVSAATLLLPTPRGHVLRAAGWALVVDDPLEPADIIVVPEWTNGAGALEAADLVSSGVAARVAVFAHRPDSVAREFVRRRIPYEDAAARSVRLLRSLGVEAIEQIPRTTSVSGTELDGRLLSAWFAQHEFRSVIVVSSPDHSRRLRRILRRATKGSQTRVMVRVVRHSTFDPGRWWETRDGIRTELIELEKLLLDIVRHPIP